MLVVDGVGERVITSIVHARGNELTVKEEIIYPNSLGLLYSAFTYFCGFKVNGTCSIVMNTKRVNAEIAILIGEEEYRGIVKAIISLIIGFAFGELRIHRLEANVLATNLMAIKCYKKCRFKKCGIFHGKVYTENKYMDVVIMEMINNIVIS